MGHHAVIIVSHTSGDFYIISYNFRKSLLQVFDSTIIAHHNAKINSYSASLRPLLETCCVLVSHSRDRITDLFQFTQGALHLIIKGVRACKIFKTNVQKGFLYYWCIILKMSLVVRKPVFGVSDQVRHKPGYTATEDGNMLVISYLGSRGIVLFV